MVKVRFSEIKKFLKVVDLQILNFEGEDERRKKKKKKKKKKTEIVHYSF